MKKVMLVIALMNSIMPSYTAFAKVTLEDGYASEAEYWDSVKQNRAEYEKDLYEGLEPPQSNSSSNEMGLWVKISSSVTQWENAGAYAQVLSPNATGQLCVKGSKALISNQHTESRCVSHNSNGTMCTSHKTIVVTPTDSGYKAECR